MEYLLQIAHFIASHWLAFSVTGAIIAVCAAIEFYWIREKLPTDTTGNGRISVATSWANPYIVLGNDDIFGGVQCMFRTADATEIAELRKGQAVAVVGEIKGLILLNVLVEDCMLTEIPVIVKKAVAVKK